MRVLFFFLLFSTITFSQSNDTVHQNTLTSNSISFTLGSVVLANGLGLTYQRIVKPKQNKSICFTLSAAVNLLRVDFFGVSKTSILSIRGGLLTGFDKRNHFEANIGAGLANVEEEAYSGIYGSGGSPASEYRDIYLVGNIGYRFQRPNDDFVFRTGIGYPELLYVGFGIAF